MKLVFIHSVNKTTFHMKSFALSLAVVMKFKATRKWPVGGAGHGVWTCIALGNPGKFWNLSTIRAGKLCGFLNPLQAHPGNL